MQHRDRGVVGQGARFEVEFRERPVLVEGSIRKQTEGEEPLEIIPGVQVLEVMSDSEPGSVFVVFAEFDLVDSQVFLSVLVHLPAFELQGALNKSVVFDSEGAPVIDDL